MAKTIQELSAAAAITDTSTSQISEVQGTQWSDKVIHFAEELRYFTQVAIVNNWMVGKGDKTVTIPKTTSVLTMDLAPSGGEGDVRDNTELTNIDTVSLTIGSSDWKLGKVTVSKQILLTSRVDLMKEARYQIAQNLARDVDKALATALQDATITNIVYGGGRTAIGDLVTGDVITTDLFSDAMDKIDENNFVPAYAFLNTAQIKTFRKDPQFTSAAEYGSNAVVMKGEIGEYLGVKILVTTNTPNYASGATDVNATPDTWGADGTCGIMVGVGRDKSNVAVALAWKENPNIGYEYDQDRANHEFYLNQCYKTGIIQPKAVCLIKVSRT